VLAAIAGGVEKPVVITSKLEHSAVRDLVETMAGRDEIEARWLPIDETGRADPSSLGDLLDDRVCVVSVQWANNETGVIQPIEMFASVCAERRLAMHVDATQWVGKMPTDLDAPGLEGVGLATFSPHKFHGPKGIGVMVARRGVRLGVVRPGSQELGRRGGTEDVAGILGAAAACEDAARFLKDPGERERLGRSRDRLESLIRAACPEVVVNGLGGVFICA
jgi:cysteine desulfurase